MLTYQKGNTLYIQHQFLLDLAEEILKNQDKHPLELEQRLNFASIHFPRCEKISGNLLFNRIAYFDNEKIVFLFIGASTYRKYSASIAELNGYDFSLRFSSSIFLTVLISAIKSFDSTATNGYFPAKIDF